MNSQPNENVRRLVIYFLHKFYLDRLLSLVMLVYLDSIGLYNSLEDSPIEACKGIP